jgi:hypothetical protein
MVQTTLYATDYTEKCPYWTFYLDPLMHVFAHWITPGLPVIREQNIALLRKTTVGSQNILLGDLSSWHMRRPETQSFNVELSDLGDDQAASNVSTGVAVAATEQMPALRVG